MPPPTRKTTASRMPPTVLTWIATKVAIDGADHPDDLLRGGIQREQRSELARVDHLGVDVRTAGWIGGIDEAGDDPISMSAQHLDRAASAISTIDVVAHAIVIEDDRAHAPAPISRLVSGPAIACPMLIAPSTSPAAP